MSKVQIHSFEHETRKRELKCFSLREIHPKGTVRKKIEKTLDTFLFDWKFIIIIIKIIFIIPNNLREPYLRVYWNCNKFQV